MQNVVIGCRNDCLILLSSISHNKYVKPRQTNPKNHGKIKHELLIYCIRILTLAYPFQEGGIVERLAGSAEASPIITGLDTPISISTAAQNGAEMLDMAMAAETCRGDNTSDWSLHRFIMVHFCSRKNCGSLRIRGPKSTKVQDSMSTEIQPWS